MNYQSKTLLFLSILVSLSVTAQIKPMPDKMIGKVQENKIETDCQGINKNMYDVLDEGKPLLIIYDGWNCGNCKRIAPTVSDFMSKNHGVINFWSPLMKMGSPVTCRDLEQWEEWFPGFKYSFAFPVTNSYYHDYYGTSFNLPFIIVIDPKTRKVVYAGGQDNYKGHVEEAFKEASNIALSLIQVHVSNKISGFKDIKVVFKELLSDPASSFEYENNFYNQEKLDTGKTFVWEIDKTDVPVDWSVILCDPLGCRLPSQKNAPFICDPGESAHFAMTVYPEGKTGIGTVYLNAYPKGKYTNSSGTAFTFINYDKGETSAKDRMNSVLRQDAILKITISDIKNNEIATLCKGSLEDLPKELLVITDNKLTVFGKDAEIAQLLKNEKYYLNYYLNSVLVKTESFTW